MNSQRTHSREGRNAVDMHWQKKKYVTLPARHSQKLKCINDRELKNFRIGNLDSLDSISTTKPRNEHICRRSKRQVRRARE